jgi:hypothetical protein
VKPRTAADIASHVRLIAEYTAELLLVEANAIERYPHRILYLKDQIKRSEAIIADWIRDFRTALERKAAKSL